jgi:hypothetical protein
VALILLCATVLAGTVGGSSCAKPSVTFNSSARATERRIEAALRGGRIGQARDIAVEYERRIPGPESWSLLGRALWRLGEMAAAEGFHRRAARDGHPEGQLGMARAFAARGKYAAALELARPTLQIEKMTERAARFVGGLYWRTGDAKAAADTFEHGASAASGAQAAQLVALAASIREIAGRGRPVDWTGSELAAATELVDGVTWVLAEIGGTQARLQVDPMRWRSSVTPQFAARIGVEIDARELARPMAVAGLTATMVPLAVIDAEFGDGVLGFDLLVDLRWRWSPASGVLFMGASDTRGEEIEFQRALASTHWLSVRTVLDGLAMQLILAPRIGPRPEMASLARDGVATVSAAVLRRLGRSDDLVLGQELRLLTRVGGWQAEFDYRVVPATGSLGQVPLPVGVTLGAEFAHNWTWRWSPGSRQLALIEVSP